MKIIIKIFLVMGFLSWVFRVLKNSFKFLVNKFEMYMFIKKMIFKK